MEKWRMIKFEIQTDDGRELKVSKNNFIYYRDTEGTDTYWEWEHIQGKEKQFEPIFNEVRKLLKKAETHLLRLPMTNLR
jgi:hypothetical protein